MFFLLLHFPKKKKKKSSFQKSLYQLLWKNGLSSSVSNEQVMDHLFLRFLKWWDSFPHFIGWRRTTFKGYQQTSLTIDEPPPLLHFFVNIFKNITSFKNVRNSAFVSVFGFANQIALTYGPIFLWTLNNTLYNPISKNGEDVLY